MGGFHVAAFAMGLVAPPALAQTAADFQKFGPGISPRDPSRLEHTVRLINEMQYRWRGFEAAPEGSVAGDVLQVGAAAGSRVFAGDTAQQVGDLVSGVFFFLTLRPGQGVDYLASGLNPLKYLNSAISDVGGIVKAPFIATGTPMTRISLITQELGQSGNLIDGLTPVTGLIDPAKHVAILLDHGAGIVGHKGFHQDRPYATHPVYSSTGASEWVLVEGLTRDSVAGFEYGFLSSNCGGYADAMLADFGLSSPEFTNLGLGGGDVSKTNRDRRANFREKFNFDMFKLRWVLQMAEFDDTPLESDLEGVTTSGSLGLVFQELSVAARGANPAFRKKVSNASVSSTLTSSGLDAPIRSKAWALELLDVAQGITFEGLTWAHENNRRFWTIAISACEAVAYQHPVCFALVDQGPAVMLQGGFSWLGWEADASAIENPEEPRDVKEIPSDAFSLRSDLVPSPWDAKNREPLDDAVATAKLRAFSDRDLANPLNFLEVENLLMRQINGRVDRDVLMRYLLLLPPASGMLAAIGLVQQGASLKSLSFSEAYAFARAISFLPTWNLKGQYYSKLDRYHQDALAMDFFYLWPNAIHTGEEKPAHAGSVRLADRQLGLQKVPSLGRDRFVRAIRRAATKREALPPIWELGFARFE